MLLGTGFVALLAALLAMWAFRFEAVEGLPVWRMESLRDEVRGLPGLEWRETPDGPAIRLAAAPDGSGSAALLHLPEMPAVRFVRLRCRLASEHLVPGPERWQEGRLAVEWKAPDVAKTDVDPVAGVKYTLSTGDVEWILHPLDGPAVPMLRLEHLGSSGLLELSRLEIVVVRERGLWRSGRWGLAGAWFGWAFLFFRSWRGVTRGRAFLAASVVLLLAVKLMVPGPWRSQKGLLVPFQIFVPTGAVAPRAAPATGAFPSDHETSRSADVRPMGRLAEQGDLVLKVKLWVRQARPVLHVVLLFVPAFVLMVITGVGCGTTTAAGLALAIESAQTMFGYGFGWDDVGDLACDAVGIAIALLLARSRMVRRLLPARSEGVG